ncbi:DUF7380 domain-containing protein [Amycolatopsis magusensis]|uniref:DUF7380 domain-containing protein n=1 Tax=Amycolatopsis magusensis TaxID=882444 RepID=UPI00378ADABB
MNTFEPADVEPSPSPSPPEGDNLHELYRHDGALAPVLARLADAACNEADDPHDVSLRAERLAGQMNPPIDRPAVSVVVDAFRYTLHHEKPPRAGAELTPTEGLSLLPQALHDVSADVREAWLALAAEVTHPVARARLYDIVYTLRLMPNSRHSAEDAARAYLECVGGNQWAQAQAIGLVRAWTLARYVKSTELAHEITERMLDVVVDLVDRDEHPYAVIPIMCALITLPRDNTTEEIDPRIDDVLDRALMTYRQTHILTDIAAIVRKRAAGDSARVEAANRRLIEAMLAEARAATEPMVIRTRFNEAASAARQLGVTDLERLAVAALQAAPPLEWDTAEYSIALSPSFFEMYLPGFNKATGWCDALKIWLHTDSPTGRYETNFAMTQHTQQHSVIRYLATTVVFRDGDMPARVVSDDDELFARDLAHTELLHLDTYGTVLANALHLIPERFGIPPREDLENFMRSFGGDPTLMNVLATALQLFWLAEYDAAVHLAVPKVEAAARALLLELNEPVYRAAVGKTPGTFPALGNLLPLLLENDFDHDWERFLRTFLLSEGANVRNLVAHGFINNIDPVNAAAALRALAVLALIAPAPAVQRDAAAVKAALANPTGAPPQRTWWQRITAAASAAWYELWRS